MVKTIESDKFYISFVLLFTVLFVCTILMITPAPVLKHVQADVGMDGDMGDEGFEGDEGDEGDEGFEGDGDGEENKKRTISMI